MQREQKTTTVATNKRQTPNAYPYPKATQRTQQNDIPADVVMGEETKGERGVVQAKTLKVSNQLQRKKNDKDPATNGGKHTTKKQVGVTAQGGSAKGYADRAKK